MSTTRHQENAETGNVKFKMLGMRICNIQFKEENFLSLFDTPGDGETVTSKSLNLRIQVTAGDSIFSAHPPEGMHVIEVPLDIAIHIEDNSKVEKQVFYAKFAGGFISNTKLTKDELKHRFDLVASKYQTIVYYVVRSRAQEILNNSVLRQFTLPWDMAFGEDASEKPPTKRKRRPALSK